MTIAASGSSGGTADSESAPILGAVGVSAGYEGRAVISGVDICIRAGEIVALLGPNGAGKTTTLLTLAGVLAPLAGSVQWGGVASRQTLQKRARADLGLVTEERCVFRTLSTDDNIRAARVDRSAVLAIFPELESRLKVKGGALSGGEQQMLAVGRALARRPNVLLADELSFGLAPQAVTRLLAAIRRAVETEGLAALIVEQHVHKALAVADRVYVMSRGRIVAEGPAPDFRGRIDELQDAYMTSAGPARGRVT